MILAVGAGLWVGNNLGHASRKAARSSRRRDQSSPAATIGKSAQDLITGGVVKLWKWRRERSRERD
ncbi:MAG: hypothetical protein KC420_07030 [Myxococcales bacterium]|nr:hypothetical protein [Myxococcales bacterium]MCB9566856.1 hypothetical protein [Myxococcales bacterium]MCB9704590.1 hypothetical protein [Myxococcales bacterium]